MAHGLVEILEGILFVFGGVLGGGQPDPQPPQFESAFSLLVYLNEFNKREFEMFLTTTNGGDEDTGDLNILVRVLLYLQSLSISEPFLLTGVGVDRGSECLWLEGRAVDTGVDGKAVV